MHTLILRRVATDDTAGKPMGQGSYAKILVRGHNTILFQNLIVHTLMKPESSHRAWNEAFSDRAPLKVCLSSLCSAMERYPRELQASTQDGCQWNVACVAVTDRCYRMRQTTTEIAGETEVPKAERFGYWLA